ncbi:MAG: glycosyltransferase family 4 protein [Candidatus Nealsonbacteria bacterium]|nr:glycosyltransferase family 4 protein [Candidatus Nealsonbacteria bacterium]
MKIGLISYHSFLYPGGVKRHILGLHQEFKKRGIESKIITPRRSRKENYGKDVMLLGTSFPFNIGGTQGDFCLNFNPFAVKELLDKEKFDVLHFHNCGFPSTYQILEHSTALNILTFHANLEKNSFITSFPGFLYLFDRLVHRRIDGIIGAAPLCLEFFKNYKGPKTIIPNGIDLDEFNRKLPKLKKFADDKINILFLGRIEERKGLIYLLKALKILNKKYSNLRLIVVGDGNLKGFCQRWAKMNRLKNVAFEKMAQEKEVPYYYKTADIFCSPAIYGESFGIVLVEAMASGLPVVAFANQGYKGVLEKGKGERFLAEPKNYKELAEKLEMLIKDEILRKEMGEWGIEEAKKYAWPKMADQVLDFYRLCRKRKLS